MEPEVVWRLVEQYLIPFAVKILVAILIWFVGRWVSNLLIGLIQKRMRARHVEDTIVRYTGTVLNVLLIIILLGGMLGYMGFETASLAGILAGVGMAIGMAWGGLLQNFAAGAFLIVLRPFQIGDDVTIGEFTGVVIDVGLVMTTIQTYDRVHNFIGNKDVLGGTIRNYSRNSIRRAGGSLQLPYAADHRAYTSMLTEKLKDIPGVLDDPAPFMGLEALNPEGPVISVRPYAKQADFFAVDKATKALMEDVRRELAQPAKPISVIGE